jgi:hypothetical protein
MNYWMTDDINRIADAAPSYPEHASLSWPAESAPPGERDWSDAKVMFSALLQKLSTLAESLAEALLREVKPTHTGHMKMATSLQSVLWQTLDHNSYHVGRIAKIRRCLRAWPPRAGGDTW